MDIIVQKYGGSSLAEDGQLCAVARHVAARRRAGEAVVVVVSARGKTTSQLLERAGKLNANPEHRELDMLLAAGEQASASMLSLALHDLGLDAVALTGPQAGVRTCDAHLNARIRHVDPERMLEPLRAGKVVVVAGFQGASPKGDITTLGRGGSDTTAVAIAAALGARRCEIYSDVDGVYTADPRHVPSARRLDQIRLEEMQALAHHGAGVLNERAVAHALRHGVSLVCRRAHGPGGQTQVLADDHPPAARIAGVASHDRLLQVVPGPEADAAALEARLGQLACFLPELPGRYLLPMEQIADPAGLVEALEEEFGEAVELTGPLASVSVVGYRVDEHPGRPQAARRCLRLRELVVHETLSSRHAVTCLIAPDQVEAAMRAFHQDFKIAGLERGVSDVA